MHIGTELLIPVATGLIGWYFARRLRFPAAGVLGPMVFVGGGTCLGVLEVAFPDWIKVVLQIAIGSYAGTSVSRQTISDIKATGRSVAVVTGWTLSSAMLIGYLASLVTHVDLSTALLGSAPGGVAEMSVMALAVGADVPMVVALHTVRIIATMSFVPLLARRGQKANVGADGERRAVALPDGAFEFSDVHQGGSCVTETATPAEPAENEAAFGSLVKWLITLGVGTVGGLLLLGMGIPAGGLVGSLLTVAVAGVVVGRLSTPPVAFRSAAQIGMGILIGGTLTPSVLRLLLTSTPIILVITTATLGSALALAGFLQKWLGTDACTALLACAPAGMTQMPIIADELGADLPRVTVFQLARFLCSVMVLPIVFRVLL